MPYNSTLYRWQQLYETSALPAGLVTGKQITQLVDHADAYFQREEPTRLTATITYADRAGRRYSEVIPHDLDIYRDLAQAEPR